MARFVFWFVLAWLALTVSTASAHHNQPTVRVFESWEYFVGSCTDAQWNKATKRAKKLIRRDYVRNHVMPLLEITPKSLAYTGQVWYCEPTEDKVV